MEKVKSQQTLGKINNKINNNNYAINDIVNWCYMQKKNERGYNISGLFTVLNATHKTVTSQTSN